jgi:hypothetical protein
MKSIAQALLYGFFVWLVPFVTGFLVYPVRTSNRALFESIMPVAVTVSVVLFAYLYFKGGTRGAVREGTLLGLIWLVISVAIDLLMFMWGPMKMTFSSYMADIGLTYLICPTVTIGFGCLIAKREQRRVSEESDK